MNPTPFRLRRLTSAASLWLTAAAILAFPGAGAKATEDVPGASASVSHPVYPALIGNPDSVLIRVIVTVGKIDPASDAFFRYDLRLTSMSFRLDGTDDLRDIESLRLVSTGTDEAFQPSRDLLTYLRKIRQTEPVPVGDPARPAREVTFRVDRRLEAGANVFWLSCRVSPKADLLHRLGASCTAIGTSGGWMTARDDSPGERQRIGVALRRGGDDGVDTYGIPSITTTARGTLLAIYDCRWNFPGHDLQDRITTGLSRSTDAGRSWEPMRTIFNMGEYGGLPPNQNGCSDAGIVADRQTGEVFAFVCWMHGKPGHHQWAGSAEDNWLGNGSAPGFEIGVSPQLLEAHSTDDGKTWSEPKNITRMVKNPAWWLITTAPNHGIQLADGMLVMPMEGRDGKGGRFSTIMTSRDHGATWSIGSPARGGSECIAAALSDGSIMLNARGDNGSDGTQHHRFVWTTGDLGRSWIPHPTNRNTLIEPECNGALLAVDFPWRGASHHFLIFSNPHTEVRGLRTRQTIQVSFDEGLTWPRDRDVLLDEGFAWAYPSLARIDHDRIGIVYTGSQANVVFEELSLDELLR